MERIVIIGCPGSGKSTLARQLGEKLNLTVVHLDRLWWTKGWENVSREEFDARLENALKLDSWIIDGNYSRTMDARLAKCDTIVYLDYSRWACLWGMFQRVILNRGKARPDMAPGCAEWFDPEMAGWIWNFNRLNRKHYHEMLNALEGKRVVILKNRRAVRQFLKNLETGVVFGARV